MLRALEYPNLISMESFRKNNFALIADILVWLAKLFDPDTHIPLEISTEDDRVKFIRNVAQFMALKGSVKLNTKRLYQADGYSVKELLKITTLLYNALSTDLDAEDDDENNDSFSFRDFDISDKVSELKLSRQLASEITTTGATLFDLLGKEVNLRSERQKSIGRQFEISEVEEGIKKAIESVSAEISETEQLIENYTATEASIDSKIERRKIELDRFEKRLQTLKKVRPAFLEEFTTLEHELEHLFVQYSVRRRCLNLLEKQFADSERIQLEKQLQTIKPSIQTVPLENPDRIDSLVDLEIDQEQRPGAINRQDRPRPSTGGRKSQRTQQSFGSMRPPISGSQSSLDLSSDTETDDLFVDKEEPELMHSDEESLALELSGIDRRAPTVRKTSSRMQEQNSDDDF
ncbi:clusterin-associated protein 1 homolog isoform X3 [Cylas formicarius]|nr:clusterin-associated protein 1 homolog isoform X3 [Cylas formicarius]